MTTTPASIYTHDSNLDNGNVGKDEEFQMFDDKPGLCSNCISFEHLTSKFDQICSPNEDKECVVCKTSKVPICHMNLEQLVNLKNSTKKLLCLLEEVQEKTHSTALVFNDPPKMSSTLKPLTIWDDDNCENLMDRSVTDIIGFDAIRKLEKQTKDLDSIIIKDEDDDCSVYKRLTRKCHCLNQQEFNDFIIHFNEETKFCTNTIGEIIKNMFIIKKFLYMGGIYTKNSLLFLNQGLQEGTHSEKSEIIQACAFADLCCIFDTYTIIIVCISWPCKNRQIIETETQEMAAKLLYNLANLEEGRRYLNFNAKITCDIKKVLKKHGDKISCDTIELLESVLNSCQPQLERTGMNGLTYHCRPTQEAVGNKTLNALVAYRQHMTLNELFLHLDIILSLASNEETKTQLTPHLPTMLSLFRNMLLEFNNSDINLIITNIMNNVVGHSVAKNIEKEGTTFVCETLTSCIATEPIKKKNVTIQFPAPKGNHKKAHHRHHSRRRVATIIVNDEKPDISPAKQQKNNVIQKPETADVNKTVAYNVVKPVRPKTAPIFNGGNRMKLIENANHREKSAIASCYTDINRSRKFMGGDNRSVIVVPMEKGKTVDI